MTSLPKEIGRLPNLEWLNLNGNQLTELPKEIDQLVNLKWLFIDGNQLTELPVELALLGKLEYLDLNGNQITELPNEISQLSNLKHLKPHFLPEFRRADITGQTKHHIYLRMAIEGKISSPFSALSLEPFWQKTLYRLKDQIIDISRREYAGTALDEALAEIVEPQRKLI